MSDTTLGFTKKISASLWRQEIARLSQKLSSLGIDHIRTGMELEFRASHKILMNKFYLDNRAKFMRSLEASLSAPFNSTKNALIASKMQELRTFNASEILMYDLMEIDPRTRDILEYRFGKADQGQGYYDEPGVFEVRLKHMPPIDLCCHRGVFGSVLNEKLYEYGVGLDKQPHHHISFSFWKNNDNIMDIRNPEHGTLGAQLAEGVNKAWYDGWMMLRNPTKPNPLSIGTGSERTQFLRVAKDRLEGRLIADNTEYEHAEAMMVLTLAGAYFGLMSHQTGSHLENLVAARPVRRIIFTQKGTEYTQVIRLLNSYKQNECQDFMVDQNVFTYTLAQVCAELGFIKTGSAVFSSLEHDQNEAVEHNRYSSLLIQHYNQLADFLKCINLTNKNNPFPLSHDYLNKRIKFEGIFDTFEIPHTYEFGRNVTIGSWVARLKKSSLLQKTLSPQLFEQICHQATTDFGIPSKQDEFRVDEMNNKIIRCSCITRQKLAPVHSL